MQERFINEIKKRFNYKTKVYVFLLMVFGYNIWTLIWINDNIIKIFQFAGSNLGELIVAYFLGGFTCGIIAWKMVIKSQTKDIYE